MTVCFTMNIIPQIEIFTGEEPYAKRFSVLLICSQGYYLPLPSPPRRKDAEREPLSRGR
jgi:hypothetical protein